MQNSEGFWRSLCISFVSICLRKVKFLHRGLKWIAAQRWQKKRTNHLQSSHHNFGLLVKCHIIQEGFKIHLFLPGQIPNRDFIVAQMLPWAAHLRFFHLGSSLCWRPIRHLLHILNMNVNHSVRTSHVVPNWVPVLSLSQSFPNKCTHFPASMLFAFPETPILSSFLELARGGTQLGGIPHYCSGPANFVWSVSSSPLQRRQNQAQRKHKQTEPMKTENDFESAKSTMSDWIWPLFSWLLLFSAVPVLQSGSANKRKLRNATCKYSRATCPFYCNFMIVLAGAMPSQVEQQAKLDIILEYCE